MESINIKATANVKLKKLDSSGKVIGEEEHNVVLTEKEAEALWHLQQKA